MSSGRLTSQDTIKSRDEVPLGVFLLGALTSPLWLTIWIVCFPVHVLWVATGVILSGLTNRNWCLPFGELPRLGEGE